MVKDSFITPFLPAHMQTKIQGNNSGDNAFGAEQSADRLQNEGRLGDDFHRGPDAAAQQMPSALERESGRNARQGMMPDERETFGGSALGGGLGARDPALQPLQADSSAMGGSRARGTNMPDEREMLGGSALGGGLGTRDPALQPLQADSSAMGGYRARGTNMPDEREMLGGSALGGGLGARDPALQPLQVDRSPTSGGLGYQDPNLDRGTQLGSSTLGGPSAAGLTSGDRLMQREQVGSSSMPSGMTDAGAGAEAGPASNRGTGSMSGAEAGFGRRIGAGAGTDGMHQTEPGMQHFTSHNHHTTIMGETLDPHTNYTGEKRL